MFKVVPKADKKKGRPKREGGSAFYQEDEDALSLDLPMVNKFARLNISVPLNKSQLG